MAEERVAAAFFAAVGIGVLVGVFAVAAEAGRFVATARAVPHADGEAAQVGTSVRLAELGAAQARAQRRCSVPGSRSPGGPDRDAPHAIAR